MRLLFIIALFISFNVTFAQNLIKTVTDGMIFRSSLAAVDTNSSGEARDLSGQGNVGTITGATYTTSPGGISNAAMSFDNDADYVNYGDLGLDGSSALSMSLWINHDMNTSILDYIAGLQDAGQGSRYTFSLLHYGSFMRLYVAGTTQSVYDWAIGSFPDEEWCHIVVNWTVGDTADLYLNGTRLTPAAVTTGIGAMRTDNSSMSIGRDDGATSRDYVGLVADVRLYNKRLSQSEITSLATSYNTAFKAINDNVDFSDNFVTFWDTIGVPLSDATLGNNQVWQLSFKGKSSDATPTIRAWIGSAAVAKSSVYSITAGESFSTQAVNFGNAFALSSDTLWFASASTADTVSVDDVVLSKAQNSTANGRFKGWLGY